MAARGIWKPCVFPDATNARFDLPHDVASVSVSLVVEGSDPAVPGTSSGSIHVTTPTPPVAPRPNALSVSDSKKMQTIDVKVIQASMKSLLSGKCEFTHLGQTFVDVTESTANVNYISNVVQKRWGYNYILVTADGLEIEDSSGTQGNCIMVLPCACSSKVKLSDLYSSV